MEFIEIVNILEAQTDQSSSVDVNIPATEWSRMMDFVEKSPKYRGKWSIVGWYHSHPNMRAFMSTTDESTQLRHFNHRGQVAIVLGIGNGYSEVKCFDHSSKEVNLYFHPQDNDTKLNIASLSLLKKGKSFSTEQNKINSGGIQNSIAFLDSIISRIFHDCNSEAENFNLQESVSLKGHIRGFDKWYPNIYIAISYYVSINDKNPAIMIASTDYYTSLVINIGKIEPKLDLSIVSQIKDVLEFHRQNNYFRSLDEVDAAIKQCDSLITSRVL